MDGGTTITYVTPRAVNPASFNVTSTGTPPVRVDFNVNVVANSTSAASGSGPVSVTFSPPLGSCMTTSQVNLTAVKS